MYIRRKGLKVGGGGEAAGGAEEAGDGGGDQEMIDNPMKKYMGVEVVKIQSVIGEPRRQIWFISGP